MVFDRVERVDLPEEVAFSRSDSAEKPPFTAKYRLAEPGAGFCRPLRDLVKRGPVTRR